MPLLRKCALLSSGAKVGSVYCIRKKILSTWQSHVDMILPLGQEEIYMSEVTNHITIFLAPGQEVTADEELLESARRLADEEAQEEQEEEEATRKAPPAPRGKKISITLTGG